MCKRPYGHQNNRLALEQVADGERKFWKKIRLSKRLAGVQDRGPSRFGKFVKFPPAEFSRP